MTLLQEFLAQDSPIPLDPTATCVHLVRECQSVSASCRVSLLFLILTFLTKT
jgi:hypothetical protein